MTYILLTGAGFSRNWGGLLANEVFENLLGSGTSDDLRRLLWRARTARQGFEDVLAALQQSMDDKGKALYAELISLLVGIFNGMGLSFMGRQFEFENPPDVNHSLTAFLQRFDAFFTLNQDTLIEQKYLPSVAVGRWAGARVPGMRFVNAAAFTDSTYDRIAVMEPNPSDFSLASNIQPYMKLHGSTNWIESVNGERILIMGGAKAVKIGNFPILTWYHQEFKNALMRPGARLMIMGYSFSDEHINEAILEAIGKNGLKTYIVDPAGEKILDKRDPTAQIPDRPGRLMEIVPPSLIGISTRPLTTTFGGDRVAHSGLSNFFG